MTWVAFSRIDQLLAGPQNIWCRGLDCPEWNDCRGNANCRGLTNPGGISLNHLHVGILNNIDGDNFLDFFLLLFGRLQLACKLDVFSCQFFVFDVFGTTSNCPFEILHQSKGWGFEWYACWPEDKALYKFCRVCLIDFVLQFYKSLFDHWLAVLQQ